MTTPQMPRENQPENSTESTGKIPELSQTREIEVVKVRPTITEQRIAKNLLDGAKDYEACRAAGYSDSTSRTHSTEIINRPGVQTALAEALKHAGGTKEKVAKTMVDGMEATKVTKQGTTVTDFQERRKAAETVATFSGWKPATQLDVAPGESYADRIARLTAARGGKPFDAYDKDAID